MASEVRLMRPDDRPGVEALYGRVFGATALGYWQRRFDWQFVNNPATSLRPAQLWVAAAGSDVVGFVASFPARLKILDAERTILIPCDLMVSPEARGERLGERLIGAYIETEANLANALSYSAAAGKLYDRIGYASVAAEPMYLRPRRAGRLLRWRTKKATNHRGALGTGIRALTPVIAPVASGALAAINAIKSPSAVRGISIDKAPQLNSEFDALWHAVSRDIPIVFARDSTVLRWRYTDDPITRHTLFAARDAAGALLGYAAVCVTDRDDVRMGKIMDVFCAPSRAKDVAAALVIALLDFFEDANVDLITTKGLHPSIRNELRRSLYVSAPGGSLPARFKWLGDASLADAVYDADNWHLSFSDGDEDFAP